MDSQGYAENTGRGTTDRPWTYDEQNSNCELALSKGNRKKLKRGNANTATGTADVSGEQRNEDQHDVTSNVGRNALESKEETKRPFRRKLPPLPKNDIKVMIRPKQGLIVRDFTNHHVARALAAACGNNEVCRDEDLLIRLRNGSNIIIASTPKEEAANLLRRITKLTLDSKSYAVNAYVATPDGVVRGVVHGIDAGTPPDELMAHLRVRTQGVKILQARMLGKSKTAVITFDGKVVPRLVNYYGGDEPCHLYRPTSQVCYICLKLGHRSDVCPTPELSVCRECGLCNPETGHSCVPKCVLCSEAHLGGARECKDRLKRATRPPSHNQEKDRREEYSARSRSRSTSTTRQQQDERNPNQGKKKNKKTTKLTRKVDNLMKAIKDRDINVGGQGGMRAAAGKENSGKDMHVPQATAPRVDQTAFMKNTRTQLPLRYQDSIRELDRTVDIPDEIRSTFKVAPIPKRIHPTDHQGRRRARAQSITDLSDQKKRQKVSASLKNCTVSDADEAAVALAVAKGNRSGQSQIIMTDSQDACRGYTIGRVGRKAAGILNTGGASNEKHQIIGPQGMRVLPGMVRPISYLEDTLAERDQWPGASRRAYPSRRNT
ncbi:hypothetical protein HPB52_004419 [Rhipicephalus sanguineus]|uniref:CCHC-type domain-containing protein n=1 Tax=Rhipicephalus sanguineus TaxID=34632 RepID=A0A9D4PJ74_RHISA|nr:hypothetical protein HPB52_004419 [Rhipicephalus sanguineus]